MSHKYYMMYKLRSDVEGDNLAVIGTPKELAAILIDESENSLYMEGYTLEDYKKEWCCDFDSYEKLINYKNMTDEQIVSVLHNYSFNMSDQRVFIEYLFYSTEEIVEIIEEFHDDVEMIKSYEELDEQEKEDLFYDFANIEYDNFDEELSVLEYIDEE